MSRMGRCCLLLLLLVNAAWGKTTDESSDALATKMNRRLGSDPIEDSSPRPKWKLPPTIGEDPQRQLTRQNVFSGGTTGMPGRRMRMMMRKKKRMMMRMMKMKKRKNAFAKKHQYRTAPNWRKMTYPNMKNPKVDSQGNMKKLEISTSLYRRPKFAPRSYPYRRPPYGRPGDRVPAPSPVFIPSYRKPDDRAPVASKFFRPTYRKPGDGAPVASKFFRPPYRKPGDRAPVPSPFLRPPYRQPTTVSAELPLGTADDPLFDFVILQQDALAYVDLLVPDQVDQVYVIREQDVEPGSRCPPSGAIPFPVFGRSTVRIPLYSRDAVVALCVDGFVVSQSYFLFESFADVGGTDEVRSSVKLDDQKRLRCPLVFPYNYNSHLIRNVVPRLVCGDG